ncbi:MAG: hypothetical protein JNL93_13725 [Pelomonas sp.]|nr:hypothetical protein [Roseateles sp.]
MLTKLNPSEIVSSHFRSMYRYDTGKLSFAEITFHLVFPAAVTVLTLCTTGALASDVAGIIVSAASIVAGLMLNLLVLIYTLTYNTKNSNKPASNMTDFAKLADELIASISFSILLCIALVIASFVALFPDPTVALLGKAVTAYSGVSVLLCLLIVLKRCHSMVKFDLRA